MKVNKRLTFPRTFQLIMQMNNQKVDSLEVATPLNPQTHTFFAPPIPKTKFNPPFKKMVFLGSSRVYN